MGITRVIIIIIIIITGLERPASHCAAPAAHKGKSKDLAGKNPGSLLVIHDLRRMKLPEYQFEVQPCCAPDCMTCYQIQPATQLAHG
jgi:hypothetical protein